MGNLVSTVFVVFNTDEYGFVTVYPKLHLTMPSWGKYGDKLMEFNDPFTAREYIRAHVAKDTDVQVVA